jgi:hypothetical protein
VIAIICWAGVSSAEVLVKTHDQPLVESFLENRDASNQVGGLADADGKSNRPAAGQWFIPYYRADLLQEGDSTYFSIRNESNFPQSVVVEFFDVGFDLDATQTYEIDSREVRAVAVKHVPHLTMGGDGYARGFIRMNAPSLVTVDYFQLETRNAFATGETGWALTDLCTRWSARFLRFGAEGGTTLAVMVNGPRGNRPSDPATIIGDLYSEAGDFITSFEVFTDEYALEIEIHDLIPPRVDFGVVELVINAVYTPSGIIEVQHQALGSFSIGHRGICRD